MALTATGRAALVAREALRTRAYKDSVGVWTIGVGHTSMAGPPKVTSGLVISEAEALEIFARDLVQYERAVDKAVTVELADHERDALVSICYNIGAGGFARSTFVKKLNADDRSGAASAIMAWTKPKEITSRRQAERDQFLTPYSVSLPKARSNDRSTVNASGKPARAPKPRTDRMAVAPVPIIVQQPAKPPSRVSTFLNLLRGRPALPSATNPTAASTPGDPTVYSVQTQLLAKGYPGVRNADGIMGPRTRDAITLIQTHNGMTPTGEITPEFVAALPGLPVRVFSTDQTEAGKRELKQQAPEVTKPLGGLFGAGWGVLGLSSLGGLKDSGLLDSAKSTADQATQTLSSVQSVVDTGVSVIQWVTGHWWLLGLGVGLYILARVGMALLKLVVMLRQGRLL